MATISTDKAGSIPRIFGRRVFLLTNDAVFAIRSIQRMPGGTFPTPAVSDARKVGWHLSGTTESWVAPFREHLSGAPFRLPAFPAFPATRIFEALIGAILGYRSGRAKIQVTEAIFD